MMRDFEYLNPKTVEEALALLSRCGEEAKVIAGGQSLLIVMKQRLIAPKYLIDINGISALSYIRFDEGDSLRIGSLTTHRVIEKSPLIQERFSVLTEMESKVSSVQTRNWGTLGGNLCHGDPAGDPAPVLIALNGKLKIINPKGKRIVAVEDFFQDYLDTVLEHDDILIEIQVPNPPPHTGTAYAKFTKREGDMAIVGTAVSITFNPKTDTCEDARIVLGAVGTIPMRAKRSEGILKGKAIKDNLLEEAAQIACEEARPISDVQASEEYRRELVKVLVKRVGKEALERAKKA